MDELTNDELLRYSRQILLDDWDIDAQFCLKSARVLIIGVGGLGCPVAQILTRAGVGFIHIIDHDTIDDSNLQRQVLFNKNDIGKYKAQVAQSHLGEQNHLVKIKADIIRLTDANIYDIFTVDKFDLMIDCTDNFTTRELLNRACITQNVPLLSSSATAEMGQIAIFDRQTGCHCCVFGEQISGENNCANSGVLASTVSVVGSMTAQIALDVLGRGHNPIRGQLLLWQGRQMNLCKLNFQKKPDCSICANVD